MIPSFRTVCGRHGRSLCVGLSLALATALAEPAGAAGGESLAAQVLAEVNRYRASQGLAALQPDARLQAIATAHSEDMARQGRISHGDFQQRLQRSGAQLCVENLAMGARHAGGLVAAWRASPEHHRNLLEPGVQSVGLGQAGTVISLLACRFDTP